MYAVINLIKPSIFILWLVSYFASRMFAGWPSSNVAFNLDFTEQLRTGCTEDDF